MLTKFNDKSMEEKSLLHDLLFFDDDHVVYTGSLNENLALEEKSLSKPLMQIDVRNILHLRGNTTTQEVDVRSISSFVPIWTIRRLVVASMQHSPFLCLKLTGRENQQVCFLVWTNMPPHS